MQCVFGVTVSGPKTALLARNDDRDARYSSLCGSLRRGKDSAVKSDRKHTSGHIFASEYVDSYAVSYFADALRICTWIDGFHSMRNERYRRRLFDQRVSRLVRIIKVLLHSVLIPSILYHHLTTTMLIFLQSQLVLSISQRNERGKNPRSRGNSSSFFLPFCSCLALSAVSEKVVRDDDDATSSRIRSRRECRAFTIREFSVSRVYSPRKRRPASTSGDTVTFSR